jgi:UDP-N-acetylmuramyl tripeptide synthase
MSSLRYAPAILIGRVVRVVARWRKPGGGSAIPGVVVNRIAPGFLATTLNGFPLGLVIVTGSSGKSTTTKMLVAVLRAHGLTVFTNQSTANISQGLTSALLERVDLSGRIAGDVAVLEMDEGHGAHIAGGLAPRVVALTNVMVDQIDRFHDSEMVAGLLAKIAARATETVVLNADDRYLADLGDALEATVHVARYGVTADVLAQHPRGLGYADTAQTRLAPGVGLQLARVVARDAEVDFGAASHSIRLPARGIHYAVDAVTALSTAQATLGDRFDPAVACTALSTMPAVFGRGEVVTVGGKTIEFVLVQNPSSFQLNVDSLEADTEQILVIIGSDVRDPSYFWPVDASGLGHVLIASGLKAHETALKLAYDDVQVDSIEPDVPTALDAFLALPDPATGVKTIIFSADGMRRTRAHLGLVSNAEEL